MKKDNKNPLQFDEDRVKANFNTAATTYHQVAVLQREVAQRLLERLSLIRIDPHDAIDVGSGTGYGSELLAQQYPALQLYDIDIASAMLQVARQQHHSLDSVKSRCAYICGDAAALPLSDQSVDLVFSNMAIQWSNHVGQVFAEFYRVLKPNGLLMFSTVGPDTLQELRASWAEVDQYSHVNDFIDMHHLGDGLLQLGFADPVMDVENFTLTYATLEALMRDLKALGSRNAMAQRSRGLIGKNAWQRLQQAYEKFRDDNVLPASYEIIYGHAWKMDQRRSSHGPSSGDRGQTFGVPVASIGRRRPIDVIK